MITKTMAPTFQRLIITLQAVLFCLTAQAQERTIALEGSVDDAFLEVPLRGVQVSILSKDSTPAGRLGAGLLPFWRQRPAGGRPLAGPGEGCRHVAAGACAAEGLWRRVAAGNLGRRHPREGAHAEDAARARGEAWRGGGFSLFGSVVDSFTGEAVDSCLVTVWNVDSTHKVAETYNAKWGFKLGVPVSGDYIISYSHPRYMAASRHVRLNFSRHRRPRITLNPAKLRKRPRSKTRELDGGSLGEVEVTASKVKMVTRGDTVVYNADAFELANGSMLDALVRQLPGVELKGGRIYRPRHTPTERPREGTRDGCELEAHPTTPTTPPSPARLVSGAASTSSACRPIIPRQD